jgi:O-antigen ligase
MCIFFVTWSVLSCWWAEDSLLTIRKVIVFLLLCVGALSMARKLPITRIFSLAYFCCALAVVIGAAAEIFLGTFHPLQPDYRFAGVIHPNAQAMNCAVLLIVGISFGTSRKRQRYLHLALAFIGAIFLILTKSRTSFISAFLALGVYWFLVTTRRHKVLISTITALLLPVIILPLYFGLDDKLLLYFHNMFSLGRDTTTELTFTGRTPLWGYLLKYVLERPLLGYGYDSFWDPRHLRSVTDMQDWTIGTSHSGYIDIALGLGVIGLLAYLSIFAVAIKRALYCAKHVDRITYSLIASILIWVSINSLLVSILFKPYFQTFLCMIILIRLSFIEEHADQNYAET